MINLADWKIRTNAGSPGPNLWSADNAFVESGELHLRVAQNPLDSQWYAAEVQSLVSMGFGSYQVWVEGAIDQLAPNLVLDFYNYPPGGGNYLRMGTSKWGNPGTVNNLRFGVGNEGYSAPLKLVSPGIWTTFRWIWTKDATAFQVYHGHVPIDDYGGSLIASYNSVGVVPQSAMPFYMTLYLYDTTTYGTAPSNAQPAEVIISDFQFVAAEDQPVTEGALVVNTNIPAPVWVTMPDGTNTYLGVTDPPSGFTVSNLAEGDYVVIFGETTVNGVPYAATDPAKIVHVFPGSVTYAEGVYLPVQPSAKPKSPWMYVGGIAALGAGLILLSRGKKKRE